MNRKRLLASIGVIIISIGLTACSAKESKKEMQSTVEYESDALAPEAPAGALDNGFIDPVASDTSGSNTTGTDIVNTSQKLIKKMDLNVETLEYDKLLSFLNQKTTELNGYVEESQSYGNSLNASNLRSAYLKVRIPSDRLNEFVNLIGENTTITGKNESAEDITSNYIDTQSRKKALEIQQDRLFALLEKADKMEDIIALESRISEVTYELERYTSTLRTYDNLVEYSTVTIQISEVERVSNPEATNTWEKMKNGLSDSMYQISEGSKAFTVWFVSNLPYLVIWGIIILVAVIVIKRKLKKNNYSGYRNTYNSNYGSNNSDKDSNSDNNSNSNSNNNGNDKK